MLHSRTRLPPCDDDKDDVGLCARKHALAHLLRA
jgi:hypothetical protein